MTAPFPPFKTIALAREVESPENPGGLEKRVALAPPEVAMLVGAGAELFVERGAGLGIGIPDADYEAAGATLQSADEIYQDKDLIIKFKGPSLASIALMRPGTTLFCMAHFHSYPDRAKLLEDSRINVIAMEEILESPKVTTDEQILARVGMTEALDPFLKNNSIGALRVRVLEWTENLAGAIRRGGNRDPRSIRVLQPDIPFDEVDATGTDALYVYDSRSLTGSANLLDNLRSSGAHLFDLAAYAEDKGDAAIKAYRSAHPPFEFGLRRIQCLHETGQAGARYGLKLLKDNKPGLDLRDAKVVVLGYGNVGQGAIHEAYDHGVKSIAVLGRSHTASGRIDFWLKDVDLVINGADQPAALRGINYLVTNDHLNTLIPGGSVIIDLVGGSPTNRSPIEPVTDCTFLTDPHFVQDGVTISALWGWPMMGMMRESALRYSAQIADVLIGHENLQSGLGDLAPGVKRALVCGPFD
jgi:alanine dehydrogenase